MSAEDRKNTTLIPASQADEDFEMWQSVSESSSSEIPAEETRLATKSLRPTAFADYIGQEKVIENISIACAAARNRGDSIDHILLHGPPGLGKTSLARIVAGELGVGFKSTSGPVIERPGDLAAILTSLAAGDVLFIDEIHRLPRVVEEVLYPAMEDFQLDILIGQGPSAKSVRIDLKPFSLVGATTRSGMLTSPLRDRFGMVLRLDFYKAEELSQIIQRSADIMSLQLAPEAALEIARRSRGTPRIANRILKRLRDFTQYRGEFEASVELAKLCLEKLDIDSLGLERMDRLIIETIIDTFSGGPVGIDSMAAAIGEERVTIEDVYEPFLIQKGLLMRTRQGRIATEAAYAHIGRKFERLQQEISFDSGEKA